MKILELNLLAFGPFTNVLLDLSGGEEGLHVVYGSNEAGKSSALRALMALLYGIPSHTADNYLHDNKSLRVGGHLQRSDGSELTFLRRKGTKRTLLALDGSPLDDLILDSYLGGISEVVFSLMFGISHNVLVSGGQELLQGGGEVGQSIFAASLGTTNLTAFLNEIDQEIRTLFLPTGQRPSINRAIADYRQAKQIVQEYSLPSREWSIHRQAYENAVTRREQVVGELLKLAKEKSRLDRYKMALPKIDRFMSHKSQLAEMGPVVVLPLEFSEDRRATVHTLETAQENYERTQSELQRLEQQAAELVIPEDLVQQAEIINALFQRQAMYLQGVNEKPALEATLAQLETEAEAKLAALRPDLTLAQVQSIRLKAAERLRIQGLANQHRALESELDRAKSDLAEAKEELGDKQQSLQELPPNRDAGELRLAIVQAQRKGNLEETLRQFHQEVVKAEKQMSVNLKKFSLFSGALEELEALPVPAHESIDHFDSQLVDQQNAIVRWQEKTLTTQEEINRLKQQLETLQRGGEVPSEADLAQARGQRDQGWQLVRRAWLNQGDVQEEAEKYDPADSLPEAYEKRVGIADQIADRLRREADRVANQASLTAALETNLKTLSQHQEEKKLATEESQRIQVSWQELWEPCGISPLSPREMRTWLTGQQSLAKEAEELRKLRQEAAFLQEDLTAHQKQLYEAMTKLGEDLFDLNAPLESMIDKSQQSVEELQDLARQKTYLHTEIERLQQESKQARQNQEQALKKLQTWQQQWSEAIQLLGLASDTTPGAAHIIMEELGDLFNKLDRAATLKQQIAGIYREAQQFQADVAEVVTRVAPDRANLPPEQAAGTLQARLTQAQKDATLLESLATQIEEKERYLEKNKQTIAAAKKRLAELCRQAGCEDYLDLEEIENCSQKFQGLQTKIEELQEQILENSGGATLNEFIAEAKNFNIDEIPGQLDKITRQIEEIEGERSDLDQAIGEERRELAKMDGNSRAAEAAANTQEILAKMHLDVEHYVRLRLAGIILRREMERYREANQGALLARSAELFQALTLGSFLSLEIDYNEKDEPILQGVRATGQHLGVEGMSEGTIDQLYLALRLATLERYLENHEPMPFVVDDILIKFDDDRAEATLQVLSQLSQKTQVIFFTHHNRLVELANKLAQDSIITHKIGATW